jgi:hypothetical protein
VIGVGTTPIPPQIGKKRAVRLWLRFARRPGFMWTRPRRAPRKSPGSYHSAAYQSPARRCRVNWASVMMNISEKRICCPHLKQACLERTIPEKPRSSKQRYRSTKEGEEWLWKKDHPQNASRFPHPDRRKRACFLPANRIDVPDSWPDKPGLWGGAPQVMVRDLRSPRRACRAD